MGVVGGYGEIRFDYLCMYELFVYFDFYVVSVICGVVRFLEVEETSPLLFKQTISLNFFSFCVQFVCLMLLLHW